jgi:hypothetical protein
MMTRPLAVSPVVERYPRKTETLTELAGEFGELVLAGRPVIRGLADEGKKPIRPGEFLYEAAFADASELGGEA